MFLDEVLNLLLGLGDVEIFGAVFEVAGPVGELVGGGPGQEAGDGGDGDGGGGKFDEGALVHGEMADSFLFWKRGHSTPYLINRDTEKKALESDGPTHWGAAVKRHGEYACQQKSKNSSLRIADIPE